MKCQRINCDNVARYAANAKMKQIVVEVYLCEYCFLKCMSDVSKTDKESILRYAKLAPTILD